ncbi:Retrovirus-related Pol polyprotein from transposon TNT 1-94 [Porphyridium purpureum]|uniref:Retrovirus-related Pol polyprotein from transposon TNT 1-94 n=1 Tax=Porphyridium purpureum TaxID=35688 RepID=A0A5J4YJ73_PORPP|nr:Retrovirus-related Pol polyprotein from transposon TNT 1-94 [Porphyridium purpureum]|eukprot:POR3723..scf261_15
MKAELLQEMGPQIHRLMKEQEQRLGAEFQAQLDAREARFQSEIGGLRAALATLSAPAMPTLKPAPMVHYGGERTLSALLRWKFAARDRVYLPAKTEWMNSGRQWTSAQEEQVVSTLATYFINDAQSWFESLVVRPASFHDLTGLVEARYAPHQTEAKTRMEMLKLSQGRSSVQDYESRFRALALKCPSLSDQERLFYFENGLEEQVKMQVALKEPQIYEEALKYAVLADAVIHPQTSRPRGIWGAAQQAQETAPMELGTVRGHGSGGGNSSRRGGSNFTGRSPVNSATRRRSRRFSNTFRGSYAASGSNDGPRGESHTDSRARAHTSVPRVPERERYSRDNDGSRGVLFGNGQGASRRRETERTRATTRAELRHYCFECGHDQPVNHQCQRDSREADLGTINVIPQGAVPETSKSEERSDSWYDGVAEDFREESEMYDQMTGDTGQDRYGSDPWVWSSEDEVEDSSPARPREEGPALEPLLTRFRAKPSATDPAAELLTASIGVSHAGLIKIDARVNGIVIPAIMDTGASHTFLSVAACREASVGKHDLVPRTVSRVRLADGSMAPTRGCAVVTLGMHGLIERKHNVVVYDGHHPLVIGLDWMRSRSMCLTIDGVQLNTAVAAPDKTSTGMSAVAHEILHMPTREGCRICALAKIRRASAVRRVERVGSVDDVPRERCDEEDLRARFNDRVSVDLVDPTIPGVNGNRYLLSHRDIATNWWSFQGVCDKSAESVLEAFMEIQRGRGWPRVLRCDEGSEFKGSFEEALHSHLVQKDVGVAYRANTHASHERMHADVNAGVRALLVQSGLPYRWYASAVKYWVLARNLTWKGRTSRQTAFEKRFKREWKRELPPFGAGVVVYDESHMKFGTSGIVAIVVGFTVPDPLDEREHINVLVVPKDDLRFAAVRRVKEWRMLDGIWPVRGMGLREREAELHNNDPSFLERVSVRDEDLEWCSRCRKVCRGNIDCDRCVFGTAARAAHSASAGCARDRCVCPRNADGELREAVAVRQGTYKRMQLPWSEEEDEALLRAMPSDEEHSGQKWKKILRAPAFFMRGRKPAAAAARLRELTAAQVNVTEVVDTGSVLETQSGITALRAELRALTSAGALPFEKTVERAVAARTPGARFVKLKLLMSVKNREMPPEFHKVKARIVAQGCHIEDSRGHRAVDEGFAFDKPPGLAAIRAAMSSALLRSGSDADGAFFDIDCAYTSAKLGGPPTFGVVRGLRRFLRGSVSGEEWHKVEGLEDPVVPLPRALYGLPRAGSDFAHHARKLLLSCEWRESQADLNQYMKRGASGRTVVLSMYVDDGACFGHKNDVADAVKEFRKIFKITRPVESLSESSKEKPIRFLGSHLYSDGGYWVLDSSSYAQHIVECARDRITRERSNPLSERVEASGEARGQMCPAWVQGSLGQLLWLTRTARPDLAMSVAHVARFVHRWDDAATKALSEILGYLRKHVDVRLQYEIPIVCGRPEVVVFSDADFAVAGSVSGAAAFFGVGKVRHLVDWVSRKQRRVSTSTAEAELVAAHGAAQGCVFPLGTHLEEMSCSWPRVRLFVDNEAALRAIARGHSDKLSHVSKMQHISIRWLHETVADGIIEMCHVPTRANLADGLTKPLPTDKFRSHAFAWGLYSLTLSTGAAHCGK